MQKIDLDKDPLGMGKLIKRIGVNLFGEMVKAGGDITDDIVGQGRLKAPIDQGDLRRSIHREAGYAIAEALGQKLEFKVRADTDYAAIQHENKDFIHPKGGQAKYLTGPAEERKPEHLKMIERAVAAALRKTSAGQ